jgi:hypothetical protein
VAALAGPGEVLVSSTVKDLVVGSDLSFQERGRHELKGIPGAWHSIAPGWVGHRIDKGEDGPHDGEHP